MKNVTVVAVLLILVIIACKDKRQIQSDSRNINCLRCGATVGYVIAKDTTKLEVGHCLHVNEEDSLIMIHTIK